MIVCETEFEQPDPESPRRSLTEVDFYMWIPSEFWREVPNHRLSLRKNLETGEYEVYRRYHERVVLVGEEAVISAGADTGVEEVVFRSKSLAKALRFADREARRFHGHDPASRVCEHREPCSSPGCRWQREQAERQP